VSAAGSIVVVVTGVLIRSHNCLGGRFPYARRGRPPRCGLPCSVAPETRSCLSYRPLADRDTSAHDVEAGRARASLPPRSTSARDDNQALAAHVCHERLIVPDDGVGLPFPVPKGLMDGESLLELRRTLDLPRYQQATVQADSGSGPPGDYGLAVDCGQATGADCR